MYFLIAVNRAFSVQSARSRSLVGVISSFVTIRLRWLIVAGRFRKRVAVGMTFHGCSGYLPQGWFALLWFVHVSQAQRDLWDAQILPDHIVLAIACLVFW